MKMTDLRIGDVEMGANRIIKVCVINGNLWDYQSMKRGWQIWV